MVKIGRSFDELDAKIKTLNENIRAADKEVKKLDTDLKVNPGNVDAVRQKYNLLAQKLQENTTKLAALRERQRRLTQDFNSGAITQETYNRQLAKTKQQINATENSVKELTTALGKQNAEIRNAKFTNMCNGLDKAKEKASAFSKAALLCVTAVVALVKSAMDAGDQLNDTATKYGTSVEKLQIWSNRLGLLAGDQEAYTKSLKSVGSMLSSIAGGRGARYLNFLNQLGIAQEDLQGKSNDQVFDMIYNSLRTVNDETQRAIIAQGLLGDTGLEIATVAGAAASAINEMDNALISNGIITTEQANAADEAANRWLAVKQQFQATSAELLVALMPAIEALTEFLKTAVIPLLSGVAGWLGSLGSGGQKIVMVLLIVIILLPKIIALIKGFLTIMNLIKTATVAQTVATAGLNTVATPWLGIITAISLALMALISLLSWFLGDGPSGVMGSANGMLDSIDGLSDKMGEMDADLGYSATATNETNTHRTVDINLDVNAKGDGTEVNEENAEVIADTLHDKILVDLVNNELGGVVR